MATTMPNDVLSSWLTTATDPSLSHQEILHQLRTPSISNVLANSLSGPESDPLNALDPGLHSLIYLFILCARLSAAALNNAPPPTLAHITQFCARFDPDQVRLAQERLTFLGKSLPTYGAETGATRYCSAAFRPIAHVSHALLLLAVIFASSFTDQTQNRALIEPLFNLVTRYPPHPSHLTPIHIHFIAQCVTTRSYSDAVPFLLDYTIQSLYPVSSSGHEVDVSIQDVMLYHYLGGIALAMTNHYEEAAEYFEGCVCVPSGGAVSALQIEAARRLYLVQLISKGKVLSLPKYTSPTVSRMMKSSVYHTLSNHYPLNTKGLASLLVKERSTFIADQTLGLVLIALSHAPRWSIVRLTQTYISLHLSDIISEKGVRQIDPKGGANSVLPSTSTTAPPTGSTQPQQPAGTITPQSEVPGSLPTAAGAGAEEEAGASLIRKFTQEEIREMVLDMIASGQMDAKFIESDPDVVVFPSASESNTRLISKLSPKELQYALQEAQEQADLLRYLEEELEKSKEYLGKALKARDDVMAGPGGPFGQSGGGGFGPSDDLMDMDDEMGGPWADEGSYY